jgi:hypothetical protein
MALVPAMFKTCLTANHIKKCIALFVPNAFSALGAGQSTATSQQTIQAQA